MIISSCDDLIEIRPSRFGKGLFPNRIIPANTVVCKISGKLLSFEETLKLGDKESHAIQIDIDKYILCESPFLYSNHSCEPNCAINANLEMYTVNKIDKDVELVWDYSTSMLERHWTLNCECGSKLCRSLIGDFDLLPISLQEKYIHSRYVFPYIIQQLQFAPNFLSECA